MPLSTDVRLPRGQQPVFPDKCIDCGRGDGLTRVTLWGWDVPWWVLITVIGLFFAKAARARVPACRGCAWRMRFDRLGSAAVFCALTALGVWFGSTWMEEAPRLARRLVVLVTTVIALIPWFLWRVRRPPVIALSPEKHAVNYEFRDADAAVDFAERNGGRVES